MQADRDMIEQFLTRLYDAGPEGVIELAWSKPGQDAITNAEHFPRNAPVLFSELAACLNAEEQNVYFTPALLRPGVQGRARDDDVIELPALWADLDTPEAMRAPAQRYGTCEPTCSIMTRPTPDVRLHYYWKLAEPMIGDGAKFEGKRYNQRIAAHMFGDRASVNPSRLLRVPGTVRWPTESKPVGPHLLSPWWFGESLHTYTLAEIEAAFPPARHGRDYGIGEGRTPTEAWVSIADNGAHKGARNTTAASLCGYLLRRGVSPDVLWPLLSAWNADRCNPPLDEGELHTVFESICERELARRITG